MSLKTSDTVLLTANDLKTGFVLWWTGQGFGDGIKAALPLSKTEGEALVAEWKAKETLVVAPYLVPLSADGRPVRREVVREGVRGFGPTAGITRHQTGPRPAPTATHPLEFAGAKATLQDPS